MKVETPHTFKQDIEDTCPKVFIVGCPRSGTSWLASMMRLHPNVISPRSESHAYSIIYDPFTYVEKMAFSKRWEKRQWVVRKYGLAPLFFGINSSDIWKGILRDYKSYKSGSSHVGIHNLVEENEFESIINKAKKRVDEPVQGVAQDVINEIIESFISKNRAMDGFTIFIEKTPLHIRYANEILSSMPDAKILEIVRDGRDVSVSMMARSKTQKWASNDNRANIKQWKKCVNLGKNLAKHKSFSSRHHVVKYEDLKRDAHSHLKQIFDFIDVRYDEELISRIVAKTDIKNVKVKGEGLHVRSGNIGEWQASLSQEEAQAWQDEAGDLLRELGYE